METYIDITFDDAALIFDIHARIVAAVHYLMSTEEKAALVLAWPEWEKNCAFGKICFGKKARVFGSPESLEGLRKIINAMVVKGLVNCSEPTAVPMEVNSYEIYLRDRRSDRQLRSNPKKERKQTSSDHLWLTTLSSEGGSRFPLYIKRISMSDSLEKMEKKASPSRYGLNFPVPVF